MIKSDVLLPLIMTFSTDIEDFQKYSHYLIDNAQTMNIINIIIYSVLLYIIFKYEKNSSKENKVLYRILLVGLYTMPLSSVSVMLARFGYYFLPLSIVVYPDLIKQMNKYFGLLFFVILFMVYIKRALSLLQADLWYNTLINYKTIFIAL